MPSKPTQTCSECSNWFTPDPMWEHVAGCKQTECSPSCLQKAEERKERNRKAMKVTL